MQLHSQCLLLPAAQSASGSATLPSNVENDYRALWTRLSYAEKDVSQMHDILALTMILSAFFGVAVGFNAYLNLKQAQEDLNTIHTTVDSAQQTAKDIAQKFPSIEKMDTALEKLVEEVGRGSDFRIKVDWINGYYGTTALPDQEAQSILLSEMTIAGFRFFDLSRYEVKVTEIYHGLAVFYGSRYNHRRKVAHDPEDYQRALRYFEMVIERDPLNIRAKKDRAVLLSLHDTRAAIDAFKALLSYGDEFPGIPMNLGIAYLDRSVQHYVEGADVFSDLIARKQWKGGEKQKQNYLPFAYFNRAAARCRIAESQSGALRDATLTHAVEDVKLAFEIAADENCTFLREQLRKQTKRGEDLELLNSAVQVLL